MTTARQLANSDKVRGQEGGELAIIAGSVQTETECSPGTSWRRGQRPQPLSWPQEAGQNRETGRQSAVEDESFEEELLEREMLEELLALDILQESGEEREVLAKELSEESIEMAEEEEMKEEVAELRSDKELEVIRWIEDNCELHAAANRPEPEAESAAAWTADTGKKCCNFLHSIHSVLQHYFCVFVQDYNIILALTK